MAKTLLDGVNEVLKRASIIKGDSGLLTSLTDSARQHWIDVAVQAWNESLDELYDLVSTSFPKKQKEATLVLQENVKSYPLATDLVRLIFPMIDRDNGQYIWAYMGGYNQILVDDFRQNFVGQPHFGAFNPVDGNFFVNRAPQAADAGRTYHYQYLSDTNMTAAADVFIFNDTIFRAMVPAVTEYWKRGMQRDFDAGTFGLNIGRAASMLGQVMPRTHYNPRVGSATAFPPPWYNPYWGGRTR